MDEEDKDFFVLVLGVLAAIIVVVSWWYWSGGISTTAVTAAAPAAAAPVEEQAAPAPAPTAAPEPTAVPEPTPEPAPEPTAEPTPEPAPAPDPSTVFDVTAGRDDLSVLTDLLRDESLDTVLAGEGPFTVFAPSNSGISQAAESATTLDLLEADRPSVLTYHVVPGVFSADDLRTLGQEQGQLQTVQGESVFFSVDGDNLVINGSTLVTAADDAADNGLVHTIDNVLVPPVAALNTLVGAEPILFASGSATIADESFPTLDRFIDVLNGTVVSVDIEGHTDNTGDPQLNQTLSQDRARAVLNYLVANGVEESRLSASGFGPDQPVADNDTEEGRALNRRIEFELSE